MQILNSSIEDIDLIFKLYDEAIVFQKTKFNKHWLGFEHSLVETEISENKQWKIVIDEQIACIFAITFDDDLIWGDKSNETAIYIHRIVTNQIFRGKYFVKIIIEWAKDFCKQHKKQFIRMDTWGDNESLITYYQSCGFEFLGLTTLNKSEGLPRHYEGACLSLFEIKVA
jgi:hypothetical protein